MNTTELLNRVAYPEPGQNVRRKYTPRYDKITIASGTTEYYPFKTSGNIFTTNGTFPLAGNQVFAISNISLYLQQAITSTALYAGLLTMLQQSYLQIDVDSRIMLKVPLIEVLSYNTVSQQGAGTVAPLQTIFHKRSKNLILPIVINSQSNVQVKVYLSSSTTTVFDTNVMNITFNGIMLDKLDTLAIDLVKGQQFSELAWTLWETQKIDSTSQKTFNFFTTPNTEQNLFSGVLPLSSTERFEIQAIELFVGGNAGGTDTPALVRNNRINNHLTIDVEQVNFYETNLEQILSLAGAQSTTYLDNEGTTPVSTNITLIDVQYSEKVLNIPLVIPATGNVKVALEQPASSLNSNQYFTMMLKGKKTRQVI